MNESWVCEHLETVEQTFGNTKKKKKSSKLKPFKKTVWAVVDKKNNILEKWGILLTFDRKFQAVDFVLTQPYFFSKVVKMELREAR